MLQLKSNDTQFRAQVLKRGTVLSRHTAKQLQVLEVVFHCKEQDLLQESIQNHGVTSEDGLVKWIAQLKMSSSQGNSVEYHYEFKEDENLVCSSLLIDGREFTPYFYTEKIDAERDALIITAKVEILQEAKEHLTALLDGVEENRYFDVVRYGVSEEPRAMRFGTPLWSTTDGKYKFKLLLVEKVYDEDPSPSCLPLFEPEMTYTQDTAIRANNAVDELLALLVDKDVLSADEKESLLKRASSRGSESRLTLHRVHDIDAYEI